MITKADSLLAVMWPLVRPDVKGRPRIAEKDELLNFVSKEYGLDAAQGHGFKARLSLTDLRRLKAYAESHLLLTTAALDKPIK